MIKNLFSCKNFLGKLIFALFYLKKSGNNEFEGNRGDMRKIHVTRQFLKDSGPQGHFFE